MNVLPNDLILLLETFTGEKYNRTKKGKIKTIKHKCYMCNKYKQKRSICDYVCKNEKKCVPFSIYTIKYFDNELYYEIQNEREIIQKKSRIITNYSKYKKISFYELYKKINNEEEPT